MQDDLISIIIPVYNAEAYVAECMEEIRNQTYQNIEVILVDDGSTDESGELCRIETRRDKRVRYFHKKNGGPSSARNAGMKHSKGKYLYFMDIDDILERDAIELLYHAYQKEEVDFVIGNAKRITMYGNAYAEWKEKDDFFKDRKAIQELVYDFADDIKSYKMFWSAWGKLYRADIINTNHICYNEKLHVYEDCLFVMTYLRYCDSAAYIGKCLYTYRRFGQSNIASGKSWLGPLDFKDTVKEIRRILPGKEYGYVVRNCYSEYAIFAVFNNVRLLKIDSLQNLQRLYRNVSKIVNDRTLQKSIPYYVQKHDDNAKIIPYLIKRRWIWLIIFVFKLRTKCLEKGWKR